MVKRVWWTFLASVALLAVAAAPVVAAPLTCSPVLDGKIADVVYDDGRIFWDPVVEFHEMVLRVSGPCEDLEYVFERGETIFFDLRDIERLTDGYYTWELRRVPTIDEQVQQALKKSRLLNDPGMWWELWQGGYIPQGPYVDSESFEVVEGRIQPLDEEEERESFANNVGENLAGVSGGNGLATRGTVLSNGNGVIRNSLCVGFDCPDNPSYSDTSILIMENNTRIKFDDTSVINNFPRNDWEIEANSNLNGGQSYLGFNDCGQSSQGGCASDLVFAVEAGVRQNALRVESDGDVGIGTANPVVRVHAVDGDTPALRLEQDGSSGFAPQTWDVAGNETSFFVRDATNGSTLPFRIQPGASSNLVFLHTDDRVGIGTTSPNEKLDLDESGAVRIQMSNTSAGTDWNFANDGNGDFAVTLVGSGGNDLEIEQDGDIGNCGNPDHDFVISTGPGCTATPRSWIDAGDGSFSTTSSRTLKENLQPVPAQGILEKIRGIGVYNYDFIDGPTDRVGLMAEDFHTIFGRGSDKELSSHEVQIALWLAVQELEAKSQKLEAQNDELRQELEALKAQR